MIETHHIVTDFGFDSSLWAHDYVFILNMIWYERDRRTPLVGSDWFLFIIIILFLLIARSNPDTLTRLIFIPGLMSILLQVSKFSYTDNFNMKQYYYFVSLILKTKLVMIKWWITMCDGLQCDMPFFNQHNSMIWLNEFKWLLRQIEEQLNKWAIRP